MEVWPSAIAVQAEVANRPHGALVKSQGAKRCGKRRAKARQMSIDKTSESEPSTTCRKLMNESKTRAEAVRWDKSGGNLFTDQALSGIKVA